MPILVLCLRLIATNWDFLFALSMKKGLFISLQSVASTLQPYLANECRFIPPRVLSWESLAANQYIYCKATSEVKLLSCQRCGSISASPIKKKRKNWQPLGVSLLEQLSLISFMATW